MAIFQVGVNRVRVRHGHAHLESNSLQDHSPESSRLHLLPEDATHRRSKTDSKRQFVQAKKAFVRVHDPVVVHHGHHKAACERVAVEQSDRRHGVRQYLVPESIQGFREEAWSGSGVLEVQAIGVEFGEARCCYHNAGWEFGLQDVEGKVEGFTEDLMVC